MLMYGKLAKFGGETRQWMLSRELSLRSAKINCFKQLLIVTKLRNDIIVDLSISHFVASFMRNLIC